MMLTPGLFSWLAIGLLAGALAKLGLPGKPPMSWAGALLVGIWGAFLGGLLATALGFGGLVSLDLRSIVTAALAAIFSLLAVRSWQLR